MPLVDVQSRMRGGANDHDSSSLFWVMLALTPSVVLLAFLIWREGFGVRDADANLEFDDQPPYPNSQ
jgi:hypothetical protein